MNKNTWFVANDNGDIIGHDMSEAKAKALAEDMRSKKTYIICYSGSSGDGYVGYDNNPCNSADYAMTFDTEEEAESKCKELQQEWASALTVSEDSDESWEAINGEEE